jgi:ribonuclease J
MLGVDIVIPDLSYVFERAERVRAIIITHGHEDHIGALPYLLQRVHAPLYATRLTLGLIEVKLREGRVADPDLHTITASDVLELGPFRVEFFHVSHSIPDGVGLAIQTPVGLVVHSGDFKFDDHPVDGRPTEEERLREIGSRGVLLLLSDSTNSEKAGHTPSEQYVSETLARIFAGAQGRVMVATFASNISRVQQVCDTARQFGRRVALVGRSMVGNARIARELGYLDMPEEVWLPANQIEELPPRQVAVVCTGSQGEPTSALVRMSQGIQRSVTVVPGDTVIVSATPIPGNEELIHRTVDNLFRQGADVVYDELLSVHVSGHASREEQRRMIELVRPRFFVPIHGEYRHLVLHSKLAVQCGVAPERALVLESGDVLEIDADEAEVVDHVSDSRIYVDGRGVGDVEQTILEERRLLADSGFLAAVVLVDKYTGSLLGEPQLLSRGFSSEFQSNGLLAEAREEIGRVVQIGGSRSELTERVEAALSRLAFSATGRRPVVVATVSKV